MMKAAVTLVQLFSMLFSHQRQFYFEYRRALRTWKKETCDQTLPGERSASRYESEKQAEIQRNSLDTQHGIFRSKKF